METFPRTYIRLVTSIVGRPPRVRVVLRTLRPHIVSSAEYGHGLYIDVTITVVVGRCVCPICPTTPRFPALPGAVGHCTYELTAYKIFRGRQVWSCFRIRQYIGEKGRNHQEVNKVVERFTGTTVLPIRILGAVLLHDRCLYIGLSHPLSAPSSKVFSTPV